MADFIFANSSDNSWDTSDATSWSASESQYVLVAAYEELWVLELEPMLSVVDETYFIATDIDAIIYELIYGIQLGVTFSHPYGDVAKKVTAVDEYYGDCSQLAARYVLSYGDPREVSTEYTLSWDIFGNPLNTFTELYSITEFGLVNTIEETYQLQDRNSVISSKELPYVLLEGGSSSSIPATPVIIYPGSGTVDSSLSPGDPGYPAPVTLDFVSINIDAGMGQYCIACDISLPNAEQYAWCAYLDVLTVTMGGTEFTFFVESRERTISNEAVSYQIGLLSPTAKLDAPYAQTIVDSLDDGTGAQELVVAMAAYENITVDWQILDWQIPGHAISINDETPLAVIRKVVNAVGAIVQTKPNGDMLIISKYPNAVPTWDGLTPSVTYSTQADILSLSETLNVKDGYNAFQITDQGGSSESITLETVDINGLTKFVRGYRVPFDDGDFPLETSGDPGISIQRAVYPVEMQMPVQEDPEDPEWEVIEFIDHTGSTAKPIYSVVDWDWIEDDLGAFQISEDGTLSVINTDSVPSESLLRIKYITKYWEWTVSGPTDRPVQFYVPEIEEEG